MPDLDAKAAKRSFALVEGETATRQLSREYARASADISEDTRRELHQLARDLLKFNPDSFRVYVDAQAAEVAARATDTALVVGCTSVVVPPQRIATA